MFKSIIVAIALMSSVSFAQSAAEIDAQIQTHRDAVKKLQAQKKAAKAKEQLAKAEQKLADLKAKIALAE